MELLEEVLMKLAPCITGTERGAEGGAEGKGVQLLLSTPNHPLSHTSKLPSADKSLFRLRRFGLESKEMASDGLSP